MTDERYTLKMRVVQSHAIDGVQVFFYKEYAGHTRVFCEPIELKFDESKKGPHAIIGPAITISNEDVSGDALENFLPDHSSKLLLRQKDNDKTIHIDNLNQIIEKLLPGGN